MSARDFYLKQEAKKGFKDWTVYGLESLLQDKTLNSEIREKAEVKLKVVISSV